MKFATALTGLTYAGLLAGCAPHLDQGRPGVNTAKIVDAIKTSEVRQNDNWAAHDIPKIVSFFAPDASVILPGQPIASGDKAITDGVGKILDDPNFALTFASDRVFVAASGDLAADRGSYRETTTDPVTGKAVTTNGTYVTVFRPQPDGDWKAQWDIVTPGPPPAAQP